MKESPYCPATYAAAPGPAPAPVPGSRPQYQGGGPPGPPGPASQGAQGAPAARPGGRRGRTPFVVAAVVSVLIVAAGGWFMVNGESGDGRRDRVTPSPSATAATSRPPLPAGVKCNGADCAGQDPELMGCGGEYAETVSTTAVGQAVIEVRHSEVCGAGWARITRALPGDEVRIVVGGKAREAALVDDDDAYTPMAAASDPAETKACATLKTGTEGCTSAR